MDDLIQTLQVLKGDITNEAEIIYKIIASFLDALNADAYSPKYALKLSC